MVGRMVWPKIGDVMAPRGAREAMRDRISAGGCGESSGRQREVETFCQRHPGVGDSGSCKARHSVNIKFL